MHNRLSSYLTYISKQFGFRAGNLTNHTLLELVDEISDNFD